MTKEKYEFIQYTNPDGSTSLEPKKKQTSLFGENSWSHFLKQIEIIPPKVNKNKDKIISLGFFEGIEFRMYAIDGKYWCLRKTLEKIYPKIRAQFNILRREKVETFDCYWLEHEIDFKIIDRGFFYDYIRVKKNDAKKTGGTLILLSVEGILKLISRSTKTKIVLFWLIKKFTEYRLLKFEIETFWEKLQKTESPPELYYLCAAARQLDINKLDPQKWIGKFRGDLVIDNRFLVMIKGWKWHHGKEKSYSDTKRERYIQKKGYVCIEFWAYEIFEDVNKCINETIRIINTFKKYKRDLDKIKI